MDGGLTDYLVLFTRFRDTVPVGVENFSFTTIIS